MVCFLPYCFSRKDSVRVQETQEKVIQKAYRKDYNLPRGMSYSGFVNSVAYNKAIQILGTQGSLGDKK